MKRDEAEIGGERVTGWDASGQVHCWSDGNTYKRTNVDSDELAARIPGGAAQCSGVEEKPGAKGKVAAFDRPAQDGLFASLSVVLLCG